MYVFYIYLSHISQKKEKNKHFKMWGHFYEMIFSVFHLVRILRTRIKQYVFVRVPSWASFW